MPTRPVVVLFHPRTCHERTYRFFTVPYSVLSAAALIDRGRFEVVVIDDNVERAEDHRALLAPYADRLVLVGISAMVGAQIMGGLRFTEAVREMAPGATVVWGGAAAGTIGDVMLSHPLVSHIIRGEGQCGFAQMAESLVSGMSLSDVPGLFRASADGTAEPAGPPAAASFGEMGGFLPLYDLIDLEAYVNDDVHIARRTISYQSAIGCRANCGFCVEVGLWNRNPRALPIDIVMRDLRHLVQVVGATGIKFYDAEFFFADRARALAIAEAIRSSLPGIRWGAAVHPSNLARLKDEELDLLAESGASRFLVGAETAVPEEQQLIKKRVDPDGILRTAERCADRGITVCFTFVTGYPGSGMEQFERTMAFAEKLAATSDIHEVKVHLYLPYPGTPLFQTAVVAGFAPPLTLEGWADLDYYERNTPWVLDGMGERVTEFNERAYPYFGIDEEIASFV